MAKKCPKCGRKLRNRPYINMTEVKCMKCGNIWMPSDNFW